LGDDVGTANSPEDRQVLLSMDLSAKRSFVEYAVSRGITMFVISWRGIVEYLESGARNI
jgi:poly(3-hydroxyalkanoate) synthetase